MDIRNWPMGQIMQLPDHCFGRRFPIIISSEEGVIAQTFFISDIALPDMCVLWEVWAHAQSSKWGVDVMRVTIGLTLGDQLPADAAAMAALEPLLPETLYYNFDIRWFHTPLHLTRLKKPIAAQGRRVVLDFGRDIAQDLWFSVGLVFSSIPKEVPDCLLSV